MTLDIGMRLRNGLFDMIEPGNTAAADMLIAALDRSDLSEHQRALVIRLIGRTHDTRMVPTFIDMMMIASETLQGAAAEALGHIGDDSAVEPLITVLDDADSACGRFRLTRSPVLATCAPSIPFCPCWTAATSGRAARALALAGVPCLNGFWSKEHILEAAHHHQPLAYYGLLLGVGLTALYTLRMVWLVFLAEPLTQHHPPPPNGPIRLALGGLAMGALSSWVLAGPSAT
ncbi:MAG: hypothetical protein HC915_16780 [Anaerolineae bacterium]|nr:hypothetical protein [Anaerolineae bacterium]